MSNTTGVYGAYLKHWDPRAYKPITLVPHEVIKSTTSHVAYNEDTLNIVKDVVVDLAYYDPPYNQRQYLPNYHILETIARYDYPEIKGVTGLRSYEHQKSYFCSKATVYDETRELLEKTSARYILFSYNSEGLLSHEEITELFVSIGTEETFQHKRIAYDRYKNSNARHNNHLHEYLYFIRKK